MKTALIIIAAASVALVGLLLIAQFGHVHHHPVFVRVLFPGHWIARR